MVSDLTQLDQFLDEKVGVILAFLRAFKDPLKCLWFYTLPSQSTHRFKMMKLRGLSVGEERFINDGEELNRSDVKENRFKTESRRLHNLKLECLIFKNQSTKFQFKITLVYSRMADSANNCGYEFP